MRKFRFISALGAFSFFLSSLTFAQSRIAFNDLNLPGISESNAYYTIEEVSKSDEKGILKFRVRSNHAPYEIEGINPLIKLLREIEVIEQIRRDERSSGFFDGAASSVESTADGFVNLVQHPVGSAKGIGKAAGKLGRGIGGMFRKKKEGEKSSMGEKMLGSSERELAKEFGVDVYTNNPYLKELLTKMARARMGGKGAAAVVKFLIPVAGLASVALTASGVNGAADQIVNDSSRAELYRLNKEAFAKLGYDSKEALKLLSSPFYSPREITYLRVYLETLKEVPGAGGIFDKAVNAETPWKALKILYAAEIAARNFNKENPYQSLEVSGDGILVQHRNKSILILPYDYLDKEPEQTNDEIWVLGKNKLSWGQKVHEYALFEDAA